MDGQLINNWDDLYDGEGVPEWEDSTPNLPFLALIRRYCVHGMRILEIGAGLGHDARALAATGIDVTASDVSPNAVRRCADLTAGREGALTCRVLDVLSIPLDFGVYDLVYDKGCWHSFFETAGRERYVEGVARLLIDGGVWINSTGSAETEDDPHDQELARYPRWTREEVTRLAGTHFELIEIRSGRYGSRPGLDFRTWESVFRKRVTGEEASRQDS